MKLYLTNLSLHHFQYRFSLKIQVKIVDNCLRCPAKDLKLSLKQYNDSYHSIVFTVPILIYRKRNKIHQYVQKNLMLISLQAVTKCKYDTGHAREQQRSCFSKNICFPFHRLKYPDFETTRQMEERDSHRGVVELSLTRKQEICDKDSPGIMQANNIHFVIN